MVNILCIFDTEIFFAYFIAGGYSILPVKTKALKKGTRYLLNKVSESTRVTPEREVKLNQGTLVGLKTNKSF